MRGSRGDLYKTHVALDMDEHEVIDYDCDCPAAYRYPRYVQARYCHGSGIPGRQRH